MTMKKNNCLNIRINEQEKCNYASEARDLGMSLSEYVIYLLRHRQIHVINSGSKLAEAMYELNTTLNKCLTHPQIPAQTIRRTIAEHIDKLNRCIENEKSGGHSNNVNPKI